MNSPATDQGGTLDRILGGRLQLRQPVRGHRAGTDAVLLAAFADPGPDETVVDLGAGVGTVGLILAVREPRLRVVLVEQDPCLAEMARENAARNGVADRVVVEQRDAFAPGPAARADLVVCNPPFYAAADTRPSPEEGRARAHHLGARDHAAWWAAAIAQARPGGRVAVIHRPEALPALLTPAARRIGTIAIRSVHPRSGSPAARVLVRGTVGARGRLVLLPALVLHGEGQGFTPEAAALHGGAAMQQPGMKKPARRPASSIDGGEAQQTRIRRGP